MRKYTINSPSKSRKDEVESPERPKHNVLIIGCGGQGAFADAPGSGNEDKIISFAHAFKEHPGFKWLAFYDEIEEKAYLAKEMWGGTWYINLDEIEDHPVDIAVVTTPDDSHCEILKQLAEYPLKLVICEKPICTDLQQAREIVELYKAKNLPLMCNYTRRFLPYYEELKQLYKLGLLGEIEHCEAVFNRGWLHTGSHAVDFFNWFTDGKITKPAIKQAQHEAYRIWMLTIEFSKYFWTEQRIASQPVWQYYDFSHWYVVDNVYNFLEGKEPLKCTGEDALKALEICFELMEGAN